MKRGIYILLFLTLTLFISCSNGAINNESDGVEKDKREETIEYSAFKALGKVYNEGKDINSLAEGTEVYNNMGEKPYNIGEYKEIDFANDLIEMYLLGDTNIFDYLININEKDKLVESLNFLRVQMGLTEDDPIYFKLSSASYNGKIENEKNTAILNIKGHISTDNITFPSLIDFEVSVKVQEDRIIGNLE